MKNRKYKIENFIRTALVLAIVTSIAAAQMPDRTKPPALGPTPSLKLNAVQKFTLKNGLTVYVYEKHEVPIVQMNLVVKAGSVNDTPDKLGLASMTANMLDEGAAGKSSLELSDAIDFLGSTISTNAGLHTSGITMRSAVSRADETMKIFADILLRPDFSKTELERLRKQSLTNLLQSFDRPPTIGALAAGRFIFGKDHPYGRTTSGTEATLQSLSVEDLKKFYTTYFVPNNAFAVVAGDVKANEFIAKLETAIGGWKKGTVPATSFNKPTQVKGKAIYLIDKPDAAQSVIRIGRVGVERTTDDYFPLLVMNSILGGSFTSRLNSNLREQHGYAYGAGSSFAFRPFAGPFIASSDVQTDATDKSLNEFVKELTAIQQPIPDEELSRAKNYIALGYPDNFSNVGSIAQELSEMILYGLSENYFNEYIGRVLAVTKADVERVAKKYIDLNNIAIIVVGDKAKVEKGIQETKIAPVQNFVPADILGAMPKL